jgi:hypothetical protein
VAPYLCWSLLGHRMSGVQEHVRNMRFKVFLGFYILHYWRFQLIFPFFPFFQFFFFTRSTFLVYEVWEQKAPWRVILFETSTLAFHYRQSRSILTHQPFDVHALDKINFYITSKTSRVLKKLRSETSLN